MRGFLICDGADGKCIYCTFIVHWDKERLFAGIHSGTNWLVGSVCINQTVLTGLTGEKIRNEIGAKYSWSITFHSSIHPVLLS